VRRIENTVIPPALQGSHSYVSTARTRGGKGGIQQMGAAAERNRPPPRPFVMAQGNHWMYAVGHGRRAGQASPRTIPNRKARALTRLPKIVCHQCIMTGPQQADDEVVILGRRTVGGPEELNRLLCWEWRAS
jgi:hypothetical protein